MNLLVAPDTQTRPTEDRGRLWHAFAWLRATPTWILLAAAVFPTLLWFFRRLDDGSDEPYGLIPLGIALLLALRDRQSIRGDHISRAVGALILLIAVCAIGTLPPMIRAGLSVTGLAAWTGLHRKAGMVGLLVLSLPVIASLQFYAGFPLRLAAAEGAVRLLDCAGLVVSRSGVEITLGGAAICVDPACSGVRMLWHACIAAMALAAYHRCSPVHTMAAGVAAVLLVIPANAVRSAWLVLIESGKLGSHPPGHDLVGLVCFTAVIVPLAWWISRKTGPAPTRPDPTTVRKSHKLVLLAAAVLAPVLMSRGNESNESRLPPTPPPATFTFNGVTHALDPLPVTAAEEAFARSFPGSLSSHRWGTHQVILRRADVATRKLHPSRDCLRAAGFETTDSVVIRTREGSDWAMFHATRQGERLTIHERIVSEQDGTVWTDIPAWYWEAVRHPLNGPWRAETLISR